MDKVYCYLCDELNDVIVKSGKESHIIKGTSVDCEVENAYCQRCGSIVYVPELNDAKLDRMDRAYREQQGIISVPEIKAILERYNIGAKPLATILGWGEITVLRYLKGQIPDQAHSVALSSLQDRRIFKNYFEAKQEKLTKVACAKILIAMDKLKKKQTRKPSNWSCMVDQTAWLWLTVSRPTSTMDLLLLTWRRPYRQYCFLFNMGVVFI